MSDVDEQENVINEQEWLATLILKVMDKSRNKTKARKALDRKAFGLNLNKVINRLNISQAMLAVRTKLTQAAISQIINGRRQPSLGTIIKILNELDVSFEELARVYE